MAEGAKAADKATMSRGSMAVAAFSTIVEWYDFTLYLYFATALTVSAMSGASLDAWGWRIPFLFGAALAGSVWIARSTMQESPDFDRQLANGTVPLRPLAHVSANYRAAIARAFSISALGSITYYVGITYVPAFLTSAGALAERESLWLSTVAAVVVILVTPLIGAWSDRIGRKRVLAVLCLASAALPITLFSLM